MSRAVAALGFTFRFESDDRLLCEIVESCYADMPLAHGDVDVLRADHEDTSDRYIVTVEGPNGDVEVCGRGRRPDDVLELIFWEVNRRALRSADHLTVLHAGVIAGQAGAIALCADTGGGKSTLCAAAALHHWTHLSDDLGPVDTKSMHVVPYPRPLMLRTGGLRLLGLEPEIPAEHRPYAREEWFVPASRLGARAAAEPAPLVAVVLLERGEEVALERVSQARTLQGLARQSAWLRRRGAEEFRALEHIARSVPGYRLMLGSTEAALDLLGSLDGRPIVEG